MQIAGNTFLVTGGARASARPACACSPQPAATSSSPTSIVDAGERACRRTGARSRFVRTDVTDEASVQAVALA